MRECVIYKNGKKLTENSKEIEHQKEVKKQMEKEQRIREIKSNITSKLTNIERLEAKKKAREEKHKEECRSHSASIPLFKKLEKDFEERVILPEIREREMKLKQYRQLKGRHQSLQQLKEWEKEHKEMIKEKLKELSVKRDYKAIFPIDIKVQKSKWSDTIKEMDKIEREKHMVKPKPKYEFSPQKHNKVIALISKKPHGDKNTEEAHKKTKFQIYKTNKKYPKLNAKKHFKIGSKTENIGVNVKETNIDLNELLVNYERQEDSGAVQFDSCHEENKSNNPFSLPPIHSIDSIKNQQIIKPVDSAAPAKKPPKVPQK